MTWVTKQKACDELGLSDGKIRSKIQRKWTKGVHYAIIDGGTWINLGEVQAWITQEALGQCGASSKLGTPLTAADSKKHSTSHRLGVV